MAVECDELYEEINGEEEQENGQQVGSASPATSARIAAMFVWSKQFYANIARNTGRYTVRNTLYRAIYCAQYWPIDTLYTIYRAINSTLIRTGSWEMKTLHRSTISQSGEYLVRPTTERNTKCCNERECPICRCCIKDVSREDEVKL